MYEEDFERQREILRRSNRTVPAILTFSVYQFFYRFTLPKRFGVEMVGQMFFALIQDKAPQRTWLFLISVGKLKDTYSLKSSKERGLGVPKNLKVPSIILRLLCLIPAIIGSFHNLTRAWYVPPLDNTGLFENKSTPLIHSVALLWSLLAGYWSWILTTSMLKRWLHHYELNSAIVEYELKSIYQVNYPKE
ncbi:hypothetical protein K501DRAFT_274132 [Backusella circina FSU 941]|nr:hypothetical protein K501DRAFT_274132 [Backusella circina FSU 941]